MRLEIGAILGVPVIKPRSFVTIERMLPDNKVIVLTERQLFIDVETRYHLACEAIQERSLSKLTKALLRAKAFCQGLLL